MPQPRFLVSDIGGTNIRLASFQTDPRQREMEVPYRLDPENKPYRVLDALKDYRENKAKFDFTAACLGVAGRVKGDQVQITNRPDLIRRKEVADVLEIDESRVLLVNDMPPHLASVDRLLPSELIDIHTGQYDPQATRGVLMPGTGVGVGGAVFVKDRPHHQPFPSEGGHHDFAPRDEQQERLLRFCRPLAKQMGITNVSNEIIFAGEGIRRIYAFLENPDAMSTHAAPKSEEITAAVAGGNLPADDLRWRTIELYLKILGAAAGNLALMLTATGGIYLGGNICLSLRTLLPTPAFLDAFLNSGPPTHRALMKEVPVRLIDYADSGLLGAGVLALGLVSPPTS
jgi:glucokinase